MIKGQIGSQSKLCKTVDRSSSGNHRCIDRILKGPQHPPGPMNPISRCKIATMDSIPSAVLVLGPLSAILLHEFVLRRVEVDHLVLQIIALSSSVFWFLASFKSFYSAILITACFWIPLWIKIGIYRAFFHPLRAYPGPFTARLSKLWTFKKSWETDLHYYRVQQAAQKKYGDYVRTGMVSIYNNLLNLSKSHG